VDFAAARNKRGWPTDTHIYISVHASPGHASCVSSRRAEENRSGTAVV
jgi:hypothetical protein